jgi:Asp-tRNA(Asn)/Glu-tRNA(Gln) amidotransferase A subunit family amidase
MTPIDARRLGRRLAVVGTLGTLSATALASQTPRSGQPFEVLEASITDLQAAMASGRVSAVQLVDAYLARIAAYDQHGPALNTMIRLNPTARADARRLDAERRQGRVRGPMHGIPIILKDNFDTADLPTSGGSLALANHQTRDDAFVVQRLRDAGAIVIGKSNMHELAAGITTISSLGGQTRNPYDPRRCPGGSSGGTGAAIAASFAAVGWGSDTCGSIRIPTAFGSLAGLRPTQGLISRRGVMPLSHTQDIPGPLARTVSDLAIALDATVGADSADSATRVLAGRTIPRFVDSLRTDALRGARIGILTAYFTDADGEILDTVRAAVRAMKAAGADTMRVDVPAFDSLLANTSVINYEHKYDMIDYLARTPGEPVKSIADILASGLESGALEARFKLADSLGTRDSEAYRRALSRQAALRARITAIMDSLRLDALVYPTMRRKPVFVGDAQLGSTCALSAQTGLPALSVPAGFTADGLPVGIELLGRAFADVRLVSMGFAFEQLGARRRAPYTTPALVDGQAAGVLRFSTIARASDGRTAQVRFTFDRTSSALGYAVAVRGLPLPKVQAVVLLRRDAAGRARVVHRLSGPSGAAGAGSATLGPIDREALFGGRLFVSLVTTDQPPREARVVSPR